MCCDWCGDIMILEILNFNLNGLYKCKILSTFKYKNKHFCKFPPKRRLSQCVYGPQNDALRATNGL